MTDIIRADHINFAFGEGDLRKQILFDVSFAVAPGEIVLLTGPSGSGKTTLLTLIGGLRIVREGALTVLGRDLTHATNDTLLATRRDIGFIFQQHNLLEFLTARQNVELMFQLQIASRARARPRKPYKTMNRQKDLQKGQRPGQGICHVFQLHPEVPPREAGDRAADLLQRVGLGDRLDYLPSRLSGGQKQRVAIARALATGPKLILADEPTASLDSQTGREVVQLLQELARDRGCPILLVTHDSRVLHVADRILAMEDGHLTESSVPATASN